MKSNMMRKRAIQEVECADCNTKGVVCSVHNPQVRELDLPKKANPSKEYEMDKTYQDKEAAINPLRAVLDYAKSKRDALSQSDKKPATAEIAQELASIPGAAKGNTSMLAGVITKYLLHMTNDSQLLQEIEPILERKQSSFEEPMTDKQSLLLPAFAEGSAYKSAINTAYSWHGAQSSAMYEFASNDGSIPISRLPQLISEIDHCIDVVKTDPDMYDENDLQELENLKMVANQPKSHTQTRNQPENPEVKTSSKVAAEGGAEEEEESEEQTTVDSTIVSLLDATKSEWTNLGDPVNPETWPKEVERAILALNDAVVKAIEGTQNKLVEGEFYSKNVDEGVESAGGGTGLNDLNLAPAEPSDELPLDEAPLEEPLIPDNKTSSKKAGEESTVRCATCEGKKRLNGKTCYVCEGKGRLTQEEVAKYAKKASTDTTSTETKKALKFVQDLQEKIAAMFFDYKKTVETANNAALAKSTGEDMVRIKSKLSEMEKVLAKQLEVLTVAEDSIEEARKKQTAPKKSSKKEDCKNCGEGCECKDGKCKCARPNQKSPSKMLDGSFKPFEEDASPKSKKCKYCGTKGVDSESGKCKNCSGHTAALFMGLSLASEE